VQLAVPDPFADLYAEELEAGSGSGDLGPSPEPLVSETAEGKRLGYLAPEGEWAGATPSGLDALPKLRHVFGLDHPQNFRFFGGAVAMHSNTVVVGASTKDVVLTDDPTNSSIFQGGAVFVYKRKATGGEWKLDSTVIADKPEPMDYFGSSVAIQHETVVVGARGRAHGNFSNAGSVFVFTENCMYVEAVFACAWERQDELMAPEIDMKSDMYFGQYVALQDDVLAIGVPNAHSTGEGKDVSGGTVYLFSRKDTVWSLAHVLMPPKPQRYDFFGAAIALVCDTLLVGAYGTDQGKQIDVGAAYVYARRGDKWGDANETWRLQTTMIPPVSQAQSYYGKSVSVGSESLDCSERLSLVVGAPSENVDGAEDAGAVYMYRWDHDRTAWKGEAKLLAPHQGEKSYFGSIVASAGDRVLVGAPSIGEATGEGGGNADKSSATTGARGLTLGAVHLFTSHREGDKLDTRKPVPAPFPDFSGDETIYGGGSSISSVDEQSDAGEWVTGTLPENGGGVGGTNVEQHEKQLNTLQGQVSLHSWGEEQLMRKLIGPDRYQWKHDYSIDDPDMVGSMFASSVAVDLNSLTFAVGAPARAGVDAKSPFSGVLYIYDEPVQREVDFEGCQTDDKDGCWPHMMVVGAPKSGTTSLTATMQDAELLTENTTCGSVPGRGRFHADGLLPTLYDEYDAKEPHMLDRPIGTQLLRDPAMYTRLFQRGECRSGKFIDWTPNYIIDWESPDRLVGLVPSLWLPKMRFLAMVREPISRDVSWFNHLKREKDWPFCSPMPDGNGPGQSPTYADEAMCNLELLTECLSFEHSITGLVESYVSCKRHPRLLNWKLNSLSAGLYVAHLDRWTHFIKHSQLMMLSMESFIADPNGHFEAIFEFAGLPSSLGANATMSEENRLCMSVEEDTPKAKQPVGTITCDVRDKLEEFFQPWNKLLYETLFARRSSKVAPDEEPIFQPFQDQVPCSSKEKPVVCPSKEKKKKEKKTSSLSHEGDDDSDGGTEREGDDRDRTTEKEKKARLKLARSLPLEGSKSFEQQEQAEAQAVFQHLRALPEPQAPLSPEQELAGGLNAP